MFAGRSGSPSNPVRTETFHDDSSKMVSLVLEFCKGAALSVMSNATFDVTFQHMLDTIQAIVNAHVLGTKRRNAVRYRKHAKSPKSERSPTEAMPPLSKTKA